MTWSARIWVFLLLVAMLALGGVLGNIWATQEKRAKIVVKNVPQSRTQQTDTTHVKIQKKAKKFVASRNGEKYYPRGCDAVDRIHMENRIYFASKQRAQASGRERTELCN